jgi:hypothetical protein
MNDQKKRWLDFNIHSLNNDPKEEGIIIIINMKLRGLLVCLILITFAVAEIYNFDYSQHGTDWA